MGEQHAGRIEFATVQPVEGAGAREAGGVILRGFRAGLGERVTESLAGEHPTIKEALLRFRPL